MVTRDEILAGPYQTNVIVRHCLDRAKCGELSWEDALMQAVQALHERNAELRGRLADEAAKWSVRPSLKAPGRAG